MFAGGALTRAQADRLNVLTDEAGVLRDDAAKLYEQKLAEQGNLDGASAGQTEKGNEYQTAREGYDDKNADKSRAEADQRTEEQEARGRKNALESKQEALEADGRRADSYEREQRDPVLEKIREYEDLAHFQFGEWARRLFQRDGMAKLQAILEQEHAFGDILISWHAACMKMASAVAGVGMSSAISAVFNPHKYLNVPADNLEDGSRITRKQLDGLYADRDAKDERLEELRNDPYAANEVSEAEGKLAEANAKRDSTGKDFESKKAAAESAKADRESTRVAYEADAKRVKDVEAVLRNYDAKIQEKQREQQKIADEQNKVKNEASVES